jgi:hypothetical protein
MCLLSGFTHTEFTSPVWPLSVRSALPEGREATRTVMSPQPATAWRPSGAAQTEYIYRTAGLVRLHTLTRM